MSRFIDDAVEILHAAENVMNTGQMPSPYSILLGTDCGIHLVAGSDWPLDSLQREHGAASAYRVLSTGDRVVVEGREGTRSCHFESQSPAQVAYALLNAGNRWHGYAQPALCA